MAIRNLTAELSEKPAYDEFSIWLVGDTPLITHAWSEKARREMLQKQVKATTGGKDVRNPQEEFLASLYDMGDGAYGFPVTGIKNCILNAAHKDKGIARVAVMGALYLKADMVRTRPALAGAICDMPLVRIWGSPPEMREDAVKIGAGLNKVANLAYRGQFTTWGIRVVGRYNPKVITPEALVFLIQEAGVSSGLGEWRNDRRGTFGAFHIAKTAEQKEWDAFAAGTAPMPVRQYDDAFSIAAE